MLVDAVLVLGVIALFLYGVSRLVTRDQPHSLPGVGVGRWRATHYDAKGSTVVVLQKTSPSGTNLLDEHVVATIRLDDPDYDSLFMQAMATARERRAMFETEEE